MKAIVLHKYGSSKGAFKIEDKAIPQPGPNDVVIKNDCFGLNFADVVARRGLYPDAPKNPAVIGYDVAGTISAIGTDVRDLKVGDRVAALTRFGGYAEYSKTMQQGVAKIPDSLTYEQATCLATQACTAYYCLPYCTTVGPDDNVLIQAAAGGVGTMLTQIAKHHGATVFGTASTHKLDYLKDNGVDYPIDYTKENFKTAIDKILGRSQLDYVYDSIGGKAYKQAWQSLRPGGTIVNFGAASQVAGSNKLKGLAVVVGFGLFSPLQLLMSSKSAIGINMLRIADHRPERFKRIFHGVIDYLNQGILKPKVSKVYNANDIAAAHDYLESRKSVGKIVMKWSS